MSVNKYDKINNRLLPFAGNGGGGGSAGIRYDEENDVVQLFYDGEWVDWKSGGMAYPIGTETIFDYKGQIEEFTIPATGNWKLEVWGAEGGGNYNSSSAAGKGGYSKAVAVLHSGDIISVGVGGKGSYSASIANIYLDGGFNGGGYAHRHNSGECYNGSGGGATHIAIGESRGELKEYALHTDDLLIVAGGGGGGTANHWDNPWYYGKGGDGAGGNYSGTNGQTIVHSHAGVTIVGGGGGTLSTGGTGMYTGGFGYGGNVTQTSGTYGYEAYAGGGGGYYGGGANGGELRSGTGGGGSGYIKSTLTDTDESTGVREGNGLAKLTFLGRGN